MKELSDIVQALGQAIPQMQTALSFGAGFLGGVILRAKLGKEYAPYTIAVGVPFLVGNVSVPNLVVDSSAAVIGSYLGSKVVDRLVKVLYDR